MPLLDFSTIIVDFIVKTVALVFLSLSIAPMRHYKAFVSLNDAVNFGIESAFDVEINATNFVEQEVTEKSALAAPY